MKRGSMMRISGGHWRGQPIRKSRYAIRPLTARMRESLFAILGDITGLTILDLFAGSGSFSLEALSRGAARSIAVERHPHIAREIRARIPPQSVAHIHTMSAERFVATDHHHYDIIFIDPPYHYQYYQRLLQLIAQRELWQSHGKILLHHEQHTQLPLQIGHLQQYDRRKIGQSVVSFYCASTDE